MITTFLLTLLYNFVGLLLSILPVYALPTSISSSLSSMVGYIQAFSFVLPVDTMVSVVSSATVFFIGVLVFKIFHWIIGKLRGSN